MNKQTIKIDLGTVQETLLLPLWARARETEKVNPIVHDPFAKSMVDNIDYDFSLIEDSPAADHQGVWALRSYHFDKITKEFLANNDRAVVINIGAGLDTTFQRIGDSDAMWINIDLPDVAALRRKLIPDSEREVTIAKSILDFTWIKDISQWTEGRSILFMAAGVLCYFEEHEVETLFQKLSETFPSSHVIFDSMSRFVAWGTNREILKKSKLEALVKWPLKRASGLREWVDTIQVLDEFPMLSRVPVRNDFSKKEIIQMKIVGLFRFYNMMHVKL